MSELVNVRLDSGILYIGINRREKKNCVNHATAKQLVAAFERFNSDPKVKIGILYGEGNNFCSGYDLSEVSTLTSTKFDADFPQKYRYMGPSIMELKKPLIAAIEGYAAAGGLELSLMADIRVCSRSAVFGVFCRRVGVPLIDGGTVRLPRIIGLGRSLDMTITGRPITAEEALHWGLVTKVVDDGEALNAASELARQIIKHPYNCMLADRRSMLSSLNATEKDAYAFELNSLSVLPDAIQGAAQFIKENKKKKMSKI
ncbi:enoyl-CoA hydratase/isomerase family protein [Ancylostoma caninum]|uniref:Enoyl-CoA hydratase/isomerase family protein n=1 Tax=Ancylostoma caninum TaxID=29170 RepID=A0A368FU76_ANCCA|nr:enoyl-CoA hydratase/isomerase family protein [Ancylostoma caninum]